MNFAISLESRPLGENIICGMDEDDPNWVYPEYTGMEDALRAAGWKVATIELEDPRRALLDLSVAFGFPTYRCTVERLGEWLEDLEEPMALVVNRLSDDETITRIMDVLSDRAQTIHDYSIPFAVILHVPTGTPQPV